MASTLNETEHDMTNPSTTPTPTEKNQPKIALTAKEIAAAKAQAVKERAELLESFKPKAEIQKSHAEVERDDRLTRLDRLLSDTAASLSNLTDGTDNPEAVVAALKSLQTVGHRTRKAISEIPDSYFQEDVAEAGEFPGGGSFADDDVAGL